MRISNISYYRFVLVVLWMTFINQVQSRPIQFRNYSVLEGLNSNTVRAVLQDGQGYVWFGTKDGLTRFDGYQFKSFKSDKHDTFSIGNNFITKIFNYNASTLWIGTEEGMYCLDLTTEKFAAIEPLKNYYIFDVIRTSDGKIWVATRGNGLICYDPENDSVQNFTHDEHNSNTISSNLVRKLAVADDGNIWIGTLNGLDVLSPETLNFKHYKAWGRPGDLSQNNILEVYKDLNGNMWIGTLGGGLNVYEKGNDTFRCYRKSDSNSINDDIVRCVYQPHVGELYIGTEKGLNILDVHTRRFTVYSNESNDPYSISDNAIYTIYEDREGGIWLGTYFGGVDYFQSRRTNFEWYYPKGDTHSLSGNAVSAFLQDGPNHLWIGTEDGGLSYFDTERKAFDSHPLTSQNGKLSYHNVHSLFKDRAGNLWIGTFTGGLNVYNQETGSIRTYKHRLSDPNSLSNNTVYKIYEDCTGAIWLGTISGLNVYNPEADNFIRIDEGKLRQSCIYDILEDKSGRLWVATYNNGVFVKEAGGNTWSQFVKTKSPSSISSNRVISLFESKSGDIWLGTDGGGLNRYHPENDSFESFGEAQGIHSSVIYGILEDKQQHLWLSTNNGVLDFDPKSLQSISYGRFDNLQSKQFNYKARLKGPRGFFYFGGINGFNAFHPDSIKDIVSKNTISFTNLQLFNKDVVLSDSSGPLTHVLNFSEHITISHGQSISFEYTALSYIAPQKIQYAYKMEGFDDDWNYVGRQRKATYTNIPAGDYEFKVIATDNNGNWDSQTGSINVTVLPPFYKTTAAYLIYFISFLTAIVVSVARYRRRMRRRNEIELQRLKNEKEREFYKQKIDFFTTMAHEIRTPLSLIVAPLEKLIGLGKGGDEVQSQLAIMEENSNRLLDLVNDLLDFRRMETNLYEVQKENIELVSLVRSIYSRFSPISYQKSCHFSISSNIEKLEIQADAEALNKILSNLLINAFKFARSKVSLTLTLNHTDDRAILAICIEDDGIGIPENQIEKVFERFFKVTSGGHQYSNLGGTGIGLAVAKALTEKHGGYLKVESEEGVRTAFTVFLPFVPGTGVSNELVEVVSVPSPEKYSVLIVEDDIALKTFIHKGLIDEGYHPLCANNGAEALKLLEGNNIDLVLSDIMMPEMDGIVLCQHVKSEIDYCHIPFVLLTARANLNIEIEGIESGADFYITKPFKWRYIMVVIKNLLESRSMLKSKFSQDPFVCSTTLTSNGRDKMFLKKTVQIIEERMSDPDLTVETLSEEMGMSRYSLHRKLKVLTGQSPNEFVRLIRLKKASRLLKANVDSIAQIGYMVGFNSPSYFSRCFYQQFGLTPKEFSERFRGTTDRQVLTNLR